MKNYVIMVMKLNKMFFDDKKIEEAARGAADLYEQDLPMMSYYTQRLSQHHFCQEFGAELFKDGAKWAINEFLKNLWHPANEKPKKNRLVLTDTRSIMDKDYICWTTVKLTENGFIRNWSNYAKVTKITRWLYLDDLFSKEGGKQ